MKLFDVSSDSTCDLKKAYVDERNIWFVSLTYTVEKNGQFEDGLDNFTTEEEYVKFYEKLADGALSKTSMLNYEAHYQHFLKMAEAGVKDAVHFTISSGLSPTVTVANKAAAAIKELYPDFNLYAVDPLTATVGQGLLTEIACDCRDKGMTAKETFDYITSLRQNVQHCVIPDSLMYLKRGGRVSGLSAAVGTMLNIKPMLAFDEVGKLKTIEKCRGMKKAFARVLDYVAAAPLNTELNKICIVHTNNESAAKELAAMVEAKTGVKPAVTIMGPVIGSHVGPGSVSCCWISTATRTELLTAGV
ncbi:MAG: DegV family protein [Clostridia bacterium]|nr:DegV family protein [Clostridia bacterium]